MKEIDIYLTILSDFINRDEIYSSLFLVIGMFFCLLLPWLLLSLAYRLNKTHYFILSFPAMKARDVYEGTTYLEGTAASPSPFSSHLTGTECVWYAYRVQEQWKKIFKTKYTDKKGREHVKRETVYGWSPLYADEVYQPFYLHDETGSIMVNPSGARVEPVTILSKECSVDDPFYFEKGPEGGIPYSTYRRRFIEEVIPLGERINVLGVAREQEEKVDPEITASTGEVPFIISIRNRKRYLASLKLKIWGCQIAGFLIALLPLGFFLYNGYISHRGAVRLPDYPLAQAFVILYVAIGILLWRRHELKSLRKTRTRARQAREALKNLLAERAALVPDLFRIATYYCDTEQHPELFSHEFCTRLETGEQSFGELVKHYPELSRGKIFIPLNRKLQHTEERIRMATRSYDAYVSHFNAVIRHFPGSIIHRIYHLKAMPLSNQWDMTRFMPNIPPPSDDSTRR